MGREVVQELIEKRGSHISKINTILNFTRIRRVPYIGYNSYL
ncbi:hypothetical protein [Clostridium cylindrosporum]|nr:hypothetical protein [Clostridium cylindrosporum]